LKIITLFLGLGDFHLICGTPLFEAFDGFTRADDAFLGLPYTAMIAIHNNY